MDVMEVYDALKEAAKHVRTKKEPFFIVINTYRFRGHSMGDPERYRTPEEVEKEKANDPIERWAQHLINEKIATDKKLAEMDETAEETVRAAVAFAQSSPFPAPEELYANVLV